MHGTVILDNVQTTFTRVYGDTVELVFSEGPNTGQTTVILTREVWDSIALEVAKKTVKESLSHDFNTQPPTITAIEA